CRGSSASPPTPFWPASRSSSPPPPPRRMIARPESWSQPADPRRAVLAAALAILLFAGSWAALHRGFYRHRQIIDTPIYERYGDAMANGQVPYRDFGLEYPPASLPVF